MKLWRKKHLDNGTAYLEEVQSAGEIDTSKPVVFVLHGVDSGTYSKQIGKVVGGNIKQVENLLGTSPESPEAEIVAITYDSRFKTALKTPVKNWRLDKHQDAEANDLVREFLAPALESGTPVTLYAYSMGSLFADNVRGSLIRHYRAAGKPDAEIGTVLRDVCLISGGSATNAVNPNSKNREHALDFTSVFFTFSNDRKAHIANPYSFAATRRPHHVKGGVSITQLSGNRLQVMADGPNKMLQMREGADGPEPMEIIQKKPSSFYLAMNHHSDLSVYRGVTDPLMETLAPYMERALRNAVTRKASLTVDDLLKSAPKLGRNRAMPSEIFANGPLEDIAVATALSKKESWASRADQKRSKGEITH